MDGFLKFGLGWVVFGLLNLTCLPMSVDPGLVDWGAINITLVKLTI